MSGSNSEGGFPDALGAHDFRIIVPEPRPTSDVPYHHDRAPGQKYLIVDRSVAAESPIYVALRRIEVVPPGQPRWLDPHAHNCNSFYIFIGDDDDLGGLKGGVEIGGETFDVSSPSAVFIPPFALHHYWLERGSGWYLQITLSPTYEGSLADPVDWRHDLDPTLSDRLYRMGEPAERGWRLVDNHLFPNPGIALAVAEPPPVDSAKGPLEKTARTNLHLIVSRRAHPASVSLEGSPAARLSTPVAILSNLHEPPLRSSSGRPLIIRICLLR